MNMTPTGIGNRTPKGISIVEVVLGIFIFAFLSLAISNAFLILHKQSTYIKHKSFAIDKAIQMMEELRGAVASSKSVGVLDNYDDGAIYNPILTTRSEVTTPGDPISGNSSLRFVRRITVVNVINEPLARQIYVRIYDAKTKTSLAETVSVLRTLSNEYFPSQVYDVYILSLENVPGWWISLSQMKPMIDNIIQDLQTRNPGLEWRIHWITRLSYGRDPHYAPYMNTTNKTNTTSPPFVYFYPAFMEKPGAGDFYYYMPDNVSGRINLDGTVQGGAFPYSIADQYNHAVRYPDELVLYEQHKTAAQDAGFPPP